LGHEQYTGTDLTIITSQAELANLVAGGRKRPAGKPVKKAPVVDLDAMVYSKFVSLVIFIVQCYKISTR
jgi:hypothetical protein